MNVVHQSFPLFRLPRKVMLNVVITMDHLDLLSISLCSKSTIVLVKSLGWKSDTLEIYFEDKCKVYIDFESSDGYLLLVSTNAEDLNQNCIHFSDHPHRQWVIQNFTMRCWLQHFLYIWNRDSINLVTVKNNTYNLELVRDTFDGIALDSLEVYAGVGEEYAGNLSHNFPRTYKEFWCYETYGHIGFAKLFIQNLCTLNLHQPQKISLNDILMNNSVILNLNSSSFHAKDMNRFVKMWMYNSNPRLKVATIKLAQTTEPSGTTRDKILRGVGHQVLPLSEFPKLLDGNNLCIQSRTLYQFGGHVVHRKDGTRAAINVNNMDGPSTCFHLFVLP